MDEIQSSRATPMFLLHTCVCTHMHVHMCVGAHIGECMWRPKVDIRYFPCWISTLYEEICVSHLNPELTNTASLTSCLTLGIPCLCLSTPGITNRLPSTPCIYRGTGDLNSDPRTYTASSLLTEPSHLPSPGDNF